MEFLRFGGYIPGEYWGCCAVDIIQNFNQDPDDKASIQMISGDQGTPLTKDGELLFCGPTWRDIFWQRLRKGTFNSGDKPNHTFLAVLTEGQLVGAIGKKWLAILKEAGFEFIRTVDNSVYTGKDLLGQGTGYVGISPHLNHIFGLFRNIGNGAVEDPFTPPKAWTDLPEVKLGVTDTLGDQGVYNPVEFAKWQQEKDLAIWNAHDVQPLKESEIVAAGAPVRMAGVIPVPHLRPTEKSVREAAMGEKAKQKSLTASAKSSPAG